MTYPPDARLGGLRSLVADWGLAEFVALVGAAQLIFEALAGEFGQDRVAAVVEELRRRSYDFD